MSLMKPFLRRLYQMLPDNIGRQLNIGSISLQDTLQNWHMPAYRVRSLLPGKSCEGTMLFLGDRSQYKTWIYKLFGRAVDPLLLGQFSLLQILRGDQALSADITLCPLNPWTTSFFARQGWGVIPLFVNCRVSLDKPINELISSKGAKDDLRVARRLGYRFERVRHNQGLHEFFHQMLLPMVKTRHEERAFLSQWEDIERIFQNGILLGAYLEDQWAGAILLALEEAEIVRIANIGWRNGDDVWLKKNSIVAALYNQSFIWAKENGYKWVNLGSSNPFANDGPLNFKLKWGATLMAPELRAVHGHVDGARSFIGVKFNLSSSAAQGFLASTPLLEYEAGQLRAICWNAEIPPLFRRQLDLGCKWVNLADSSNEKASA